MSNRSRSKTITVQDAPVTPPTHTVKGKLTEMQTGLVMRLAAQRQNVMQQAQAALDQINGELAEIANLVAGSLGLPLGVKYDLYVAPDGGVFIVEQVKGADNADDRPVQPA